MTEFKPKDLIERFQGRSTSTIKNGVPLTFKRYLDPVYYNVLQVEESNELFDARNFRKWVEIKLPNVKRKIKIGDLVTDGKVTGNVIDIHLNSLTVSNDRKFMRNILKDNVKLLKTAEEIKAEEISAQKEKDNLNLFEKQACRDIDEKIKGVANNDDLIKVDQIMKKAYSDIEAIGNIYVEHSVTQGEYNLIVDPKMPSFSFEPFVGLAQEIKTEPNNINPLTLEDNVVVHALENDYGRLKRLLLKSTTCSGTELLVYMINEKMI